MINCFLFRWARADPAEDLCQLDQLVLEQEKASDEGGEPDRGLEGRGEAARPARGLERGTSSDGTRSGSPSTSLSLQLQHCARVPQEQTGKGRFFSHIVVVYCLHLVQAICKHDCWVIAILTGVDQMRLGLMRLGHKSELLLANELDAYKYFAMSLMLIKYKF